MQRRVRRAAWAHRRPPRPFRLSSVSRSSSSVRRENVRSPGNELPTCAGALLTEQYDFAVDHGIFKVGSSDNRSKIVKDAFRLLSAETAESWNSSYRRSPANPAMQSLCSRSIAPHPHTWGYLHQNDRGCPPCREEVAQLSPTARRSIRIDLIQLFVGQS